MTDAGTGDAVARKATLKDVAELAGVSTATVARVIHSNGYVAAETRRLVEAALAETDYQLNAIAQGLRTQRTLTLGHILQSIAPNPFFAAVALGVEQEAATHGCSVLLYDTHGDVDRERVGVETLIRRRVDAMLFTTAVAEASVTLALRAGIPVVQVERPSRLPTPIVTVDNYVGAVAAVEHLIGLGHRQIAFIGDDPDGNLNFAPLSREVERERLVGYLDTMRRHGLPVDDRLVHLGLSYSREAGHAATRRLLACDTRPTAIFATCDLLAAGVLQALYEAHLSVPGDVSVIGFDDTYAAYAAPPLTTVAQPMVEMGKSAAILALDALNPAALDGQPATVRLMSKLVVRESTGPPAT